MAFLVAVACTVFSSTFQIMKVVILLLSPASSYFLRISCQVFSSERCFQVILMPAALCVRKQVLFFFSCGPTRAMASSFLRFLDHTQRCITVGKTPLDERSARRRDFYLTTHNTHNRQTSVLPVGFETTISAGERPQTYALDRTATGIGNKLSYVD